MPGARWRISSNAKKAHYAADGACLILITGREFYIKTDAGMLVKPVFRPIVILNWCRMLTDERSQNVQHYLDHECFHPLADA